MNTKNIPIVEMRSWGDNRQLARVIILSSLLMEIFPAEDCPERFVKWLEQANPQFDGHSPAAVLRDGDYRVVADLIDDMITGSPT